MAAYSDALRNYLRGLAGWVWNQQGHALSHGNGLVIHEETITEMLLLRMAKDQAKHNIKIQMFSKAQEVINGSDWEWHLRTKHCRHGLRVQAKRLYVNPKGPEYLGLDLKKAQHGNLISKARAAGLTPAYVFYNHDKSPSSRKFDNSGLPEYRGRSHWGCAIAHAKDVTSNRLNVLKGVMKPWHELIPTNGRCSFSTAAPSVSAAATPGADGYHQDGGPPLDMPVWVERFSDRQFLEQYLEEQELGGVAHFDFSDITS